MYQKQKQHNLCEIHHTKLNRLLVLVYTTLLYMIQNLADLETVFKHEIETSVKVT